MTQELLAKLESIDMGKLTDIVQQDQQSPSFEILEWSFKRLSDKGIQNPDGLWLLSGIGSDSAGLRPWSLVLKIIKRKEPEPPLSNLWHWKRELFFAQSGLIKTLSGRVKAPRIYSVEETSDGAWMWLEHIENNSPNPWTTKDYAFAAYELGYWNGLWACSKSLPTEPWLSRQPYRSWYDEADPDQDFQFPLNRKYISGDYRHRYEKLWADREMFYNVSDSLPQTFSHFDSQRRNLFIRKGVEDRDELVLVDWAQCGLGPLGAELNFLVAASAGLFEWPVSRLSELDAATFGSYVKGLEEAGWSGDADMVRLGYLAWEIMWWGIVWPNIAAMWCTPEFRPITLQQFGMAEEALFLYWLPFFHYSLDCADEARMLMG